MYSSTWWWHNDANDGPSTIVWAYVFLEDIINSKNVQSAYSYNLKPNIAKYNKVIT